MAGEKNVTNAHKTKNGTPQKDYNYAYQFDSIGNRLSETRNSFSLTYQNNSLDQITNRAWSGGLTVQGYAGSRSNTAVLGSAVGVDAVDVNVQSATLDTNGEYLVESVPVNAGTNNLITAVNKDYPLPPNGSTNLAGTKSVIWEKIAVEPSQIAMKYDVSGNLTNDGVRSYSWNGEGMLVRIQGSGFRADYGYDGQSRKVRSRDYVYTNSTWQLTADRVFVYDGWNPVVELTNQSSTLPSFHLSKSYTWGIDLSGTLSGAGGVGGLLSATTHCSPLTTHWFAYDGNGNVVNLVDADTGAISAHYEYDPFGRLVCKESSYADDNEYRFSTKRYCAMWSLYDYGYRHYSTDLGRWMSRDPIGEEEAARANISKNDHNIYAYVANAPCDHVDNLGLFGAPFADPHAAEEWSRTISSSVAEAPSKGNKPCCNGHPYDPKKQCCCENGKVVYVGGPDAKILKDKPVFTGVVHGKWTSATGGVYDKQVHHWLAWAGGSVEANFQEGQRVNSPAMGPKILKYEAGSIKRTKIRLSPCVVVVTSYKQCVIDVANRRKGKAYGGFCGDFVEEVKRECRSTVTGCGL